MTKRPNDLYKRLTILIGLAMLVTVFVVAALPANWFEAARIAGIVVKTESNVVKATINLGNLTSASDFELSGEGIVSIAESGGLKIGKFVLGYPQYTPEEGYVYERYVTSRFYSLSLNLTIEDTTTSMPIVVDGYFQYWNYEFDEYPWTYRSYPYWSAMTLAQGNHTVVFTLYGTTALTTKTLNVEMAYYFALTPP